MTVGNDCQHDQGTSKNIQAIVAYVQLKIFGMLQWRWPAKRRSIRVCLDLFVTFWGNAKK